MLMAYFDTLARNHQPYKGGAWCYEDGLIYRGLESLHRATGETRWLDHLVRLIEPQLLEGPDLAEYKPSDYNIDNINAGRALMYLHDVTSDEKWLRYAELLMDQLATQPRTTTGVYWHKLRYPWQVWLDGIYMCPPFQISYGLRTNNDALVADSLIQMKKALEHTYVPETGLYAHAFDEARKQPWADKNTGHPKAHWARALGWLAMALVDVAELVGPERFAPLKSQTEDLLTKIANLRRPSGLWLQVIDQPDFPENWEETSASVMFVYALNKAKKLGLGGAFTKDMATKVLMNSLRPKPNGGLEMVQICHVAGLGMYQGRFRDGSAAYYISETCAIDDPKGVGPLMTLAALSLDAVEEFDAFHRVT
ncbi:glycoside hydrolase family 88 protein [uncultured Pelagimonas sp.]|uniref:glycoside hydrolase family 88/105 protein n=1 Tax=uncultured Pelagimonas sp. TaxID=1618102 RepID=UPI0026020E02|nr:glycoside hydrolase family 88 protein [uncultured Pelagimonas sp.]